ncbi:MAG: transglycosylase domain-containing protein [Acidimicrobiales bacterium]
MRTAVRLVKRFASLGIVLVVLAVVMAASFMGVAPQVVAMVTANEGEAADLELDDLAARSEVYAADGSLLTLLVGQENRKPISIDDVPQPVIDSILAIEDAQFYEHDGVNIRGTVRAAVENVNAGGITQGGSTITQQVVKNSLLTTDQNLNRKSTEAFYALRLERQMSKDEILERYLNTVYLGSGAYGVEAAAETYWGYDSAAELGWPEAALLAGMIRSPVNYDPTNNPEEAKARRKVVLDRLVALGYLNQGEADTYDLAPLPAEEQKPISTQPTDYFDAEVRDELLQNEAILGGDADSRLRAVYQGGLKVYTTFDPGAQQAAVAARDELLPNIKENCLISQRLDRNPDNPCLPEFTAAIVTLDSHTGAVRAMVGGEGFDRVKYNAVTQGGRQPGSTMKPIVLASLFEQGYTPNDDVRTDRPCSFPNPGGTPNPYVVDKTARSRGGIQSVAVATRQSNNCSFVRLGLTAGLDNVIDMAGRLGIDNSAMEPQLSLPLGVYDVVPLQMAGAFSTFANDGILNEPWYIDRIEDRDGNVIFQHEVSSSRAISTQTARMITQTLEGNVDVLGGTGTGRRARVPGQRIAGKTGTTQSNFDAWFIGFSDYYTTAVWVGDPNGQVRVQFPEWAQRGWSASGKGGFGGELPAEIFGAYMTTLHANLEPREFPEPDPYRGGNYLKAPGEVDFCDGTRRSFTGRTIVVDSDGDGVKDCFRAVTTTTAPPATTAPSPTTGGGGDTGGGDNNGENGAGANNGNGGGGANNGNGNNGNGNNGGGNNGNDQATPPATGE